MPTTRPRHMITESDRIAEALELAALKWPEHSEDRGALLRKILEIGLDSLSQSASQETSARLQQIAKAAGSMDGIWPKNWREELSQDWPA